MASVEIPGVSLSMIVNSRPIFSERPRRKIQLSDVLEFELVRGQSSVIDRDSIEQSIAEANSQALEDGHTEKVCPPLTLLDIMTALVWGGSSAADPVIDNIHHTMLQNILLDDPWPELTREAVILLIGKRKDKADRLGFYNIQWHHGHNEPFKAGMPLTYSDGEPLPPLTLAEKLLATRHRGWLTAGSSRRHGPKTVFPPKPVDGGAPQCSFLKAKRPPAKRFV